MSYPPSQPSYYGQSQPNNFGYPGQTPAQGQGYPAQAQGYPAQGQGYPAQTQGYPNQAQGYPSQGQPAAYSGYPSTQPQQSYTATTPTSSSSSYAYPPSTQQYGSYPSSQGVTSGYTQPQATTTSYPQQTTNYPPTSTYPDTNATYGMNTASTTLPPPPSATPSLLQPHFPSHMTSTSFTDTYASASSSSSSTVLPPRPSFPQNNTGYPSSSSATAPLPPPPTGPNARLLPPQPATAETYMPPPSVAKQLGTIVPPPQPSPTGYPQQQQQQQQQQRSFGDDDYQSGNYQQHTSHPTGFDDTNYYNRNQSTSTSLEQDFNRMSLSNSQFSQQQQPSTTATPSISTSAAPITGGSNNNQRVTGNIIPPWVQPLNSKFLSFSVNAIPNNISLRNRSQLLFGGILCPLANTSSSSTTTSSSSASSPATPASSVLPVINPGTTGVIRCKECRGYINPYVQFLNNGAHWKCNMCGLQNDVPAPYFAPVDSYGKRVDINDRPELLYSSVEILAPQDYMVRPPMPPVYFFVIDVSSHSIKSGMVATVASTISKFLDTIPEGTRTKFGLITFDSTIHYYSFKSSSSSGSGSGSGSGSSIPQMYVISDLDDIFLPVEEQDLLVNLDENRNMIQTLLLSLSTMHATTYDVESALGSAMEAAAQILVSIGGKLCIFLSQLPSLGLGRLLNRENMKLLNTDKEQTLYQPINDYYKKFAIKCVRFQISIDLFCFTHSDQFIDIATLSEMSKYTGGSCYYYPNFNSSSTTSTTTSSSNGSSSGSSGSSGSSSNENVTAMEHSAKLDKELYHVLTREQGWESVIRIRGSKGIRIGDFTGNFYLRGTDLISCPTIDENKNFSFTIYNDEQAITMNTVTIQAALLYTTTSGERRIRVHTCILPVTSLLHDLYEYCNVNTLTCIVAKNAVAIAMGQGLEPAREIIKQRCIQIMRTHKTLVQKQYVSYNNIQYMSLYPLLTLALLKHTLYKDGTDIRIDIRSYSYFYIIIMGLIEFESWIRPRLLNIDTNILSSNYGLANIQSITNYQDQTTSLHTSHNMIDLPPELNLSIESIKSENIYIIDNHMEIIIRISKNVDTFLLQNLFGVYSFDLLDTKQCKLLQPDVNDQTSVCRRLHNIINYLRSISINYQTLTIVKEGEASDTKFLNLLIEDKNLTAMSLLEFINFINRPGAN